MAERHNGRPGVRTVHEESTAHLVQRASEQVSRLVRDELALARAELRNKGRHAGRGAGLLGSGGLVALYGVGALVLAAIFGLALVMPDWLAAVVVGAVLLVIAGILALAGSSQVQQAVPPTPDRTMRSFRDDLDVVTDAVRGRGRP
jgi:Flp pilus assembly protein TadB